MRHDRPLFNHDATVTATPAAYGRCARCGKRTHRVRVAWKCTKPQRNACRRTTCLYCFIWLITSIRFERLAAKIAANGDRSLEERLIQADPFGGLRARTVDDPKLTELH